MQIPNSAEIVIIGGGVMGASTAYHLAVRGQKNILILEREQFFGQGATGRCAGGVRYQFGTEVNVRLSLKSLPMLECFEDETGQPIDFRKCGYLFLLTSEADLQVFKLNLAMQQSLGVKTQWLLGDDIRQMLPMMALNDVLGGTYNSEDGLVDPNSVVMGYISASQKLGVQALTEIEVTGIRIERERVIGVNTNSGFISAPIVVNAAGPWAGVIGKMAGVDIPIIPIRRQILTTSALPDIPADFPFVIDFTQSLYFHREGPGILTGMSNPDQAPGFDQNVDLEWELVHLEAAANRLPLLQNARLSSRWAGLYEVTPDAHPILGRTPVEGLFVCAGFSGHGFMHGPITGKLMSEFILDGSAVSVDVAMLDLDRFQEGRLIREYNVV